MLLDIDHFKQVNDQYGHLVGDTVLQEVAAILTKETRARDIVGRWGGEEFMVVLPNAGNGRALEIAESIRMAIKNHFFGKAGHITISIGVCEVSEKLRTLEVIDLADRALYKAKDSGRDRVCMSYKRGPINPHAIDAQHIEVKQQEKLHAPA
jgi:diguanylate cyclase (GGDEF)-like protein